MLLHKNYNDQNIYDAVKKAIEVNVSGSDAVFQILMNSLKKSPKPFAPLKNWGIVSTPDVSVYDETGDAI